MLENFQGDSWGLIPPLRMPSLLPHDLCHGQSSLPAMDCSSPGSSCPWDSPGKNTEVGCTMPSSRGSSQPMNETHVSCIADRVFTHWGTWEALVPSYYMPFILCTVCLTSLGYKLHVIFAVLFTIMSLSPNSAYYMPSKSVLSNWLNKCGGWDDDLHAVENLTVTYSCPLHRICRFTTPGRVVL